MNKSRYDGLPENLRKVIDANSGAETSAWIGKVYDEADGPARKKLADNGNAINTLPAAELEKWKVASGSVAEQWVKDVSAEGRRRRPPARSGTRADRHPQPVNLVRRCCPVTLPGRSTRRPQYRPTKRRAP